MANLKTLKGISEAREKLYNEMESGKFDEKQMLAKERVLRGQVDLKATVPLRLIGIVARAKNSAVEKYAEPLFEALHEFVLGKSLEIEKKD